MIKNAKIHAVQADPEEYHRIEVPRGDPAYPVSVSMLKAFIVCPARWAAGYVPPDSEAKRWGSLLDDFILSPDRFATKYVLRPATYPAPDKHPKVKKGLIEPGDPLPWNSNAGWCEAWLAEHEGQEVVKPDEIANLEASTAALRADETIRNFLDASDKQIWLTGEWHDRETGLVVPLKALVDLVPRKDSEFPKSLGDFKTTRNAGVRAWQRWSNSVGYHVQAAFYMDLYVAATEEDRINFGFIVQENFAPWQTAKRLMSGECIEMGRAEYQQSIQTYCSMLKRGRWANYDNTDEAVQGWTIVYPEPWMDNAFGPKFVDEEEPEAEAKEEAPDDLIP